MIFAMATASAIPTTAGLEGSGLNRDIPEIPGRTNNATTDTPMIVGGVREPRFGATVALSFPQLGTFCSASMITPRVALTAAHCVSEQGITPALVEQAGSVLWGPIASEPTQATGIVRVIPHPNYGTNAQGLPANDIALIEIEPVAYTDTVWINEAELIEDQIGQTFVSVGFGVNENGEQSSGRKRSAEVTYDEFFADFMVSNADTNPRNANVCSGDSGGPMYQVQPDGRFIQYAVHSWSQPPVCRGLAGSTSTASFSTFILNQVELIHGSADMCENRGANTDVFCDPGCPNDVICAIQEATGGKSCQTGSTGSGWLVLLGFAGLLVRRR